MTQTVKHQRAGVATPVTLINAFSVPMEQGERFLERWRANAALMAASPGLIVSRMMRAVTDQAELTFVNVADWESGTALDAARANPEWLASIQRLLDDPELDVTARPMVYQVAVEVRPGEDPT